MFTLLIAGLSFIGFIVAYHTYGRWLSKRIFDLDQTAVVPSQEMRDNVDFVPTRRSVVFGHHFTSIAGTGPIVGPAIAVFWGWLPALLWVLVGSIFIGAVHDFAALVISLRNRGQTVGEIAGRVISPRARLLFLLILFFALAIVLGVFGLVIAIIFSQYPGTVFPVWISLPLAIMVGYLFYRRGANMLGLSMAALVAIYFAIWLGAYHLPITIQFGNPVVIWTMVLLAYCFFASVLPVWFLLQPRDYVNSHQLILALVLLVAGLVVAGITGQADLANSTPAITAAATLPAGTPPIWPFLFITIACGAISGFHCLVSSGTSSKQLASEGDAQMVGYGAMLLEGGLAVVVILACCAGLGMGITTETGTLTGLEAWNTKYNAETWAGFTLAKKVDAFVLGGANFIGAIGIPLKMGIGIVAVLVACFAATTLDTATRLQRYVVQELGATLHCQPLENKYAATLLAVVCGGAIAMIPGPQGPGTGGMILWPLFGATNQLLAGLAFLVIVFYLWRRNKPIWFAALPMALMIVLPAWALSWQIFNAKEGWIYGYSANSWVLLLLGGGILALQIWMVIEAMMAWNKAKGVLEKPLPPLPTASRQQPGTKTAAGRH